MQMKAFHSKFSFFKIIHILKLKLKKIYPI